MSILTRFRTSGSIDVEPWSTGIEQQGVYLLPMIAVGIYRNYSGTSMRKGKELVAMALPDGGTSCFLFKDTVVIGKSGWNLKFTAVL